MIPIRKCKDFKEAIKDTNAYTIKSTLLYTGLVLNKLKRKHLIILQIPRVPVQCVIVAENILLCFYF